MTKRQLGFQARWLRWRGIPLLVLLAALALTIAYWQREQAERAQLRQQAFDSALGDARLLVEQRLAGHRHLLQGVQGFLDAAALDDATANAAGLGRYVSALQLGREFADVRAIAVARGGHRDAGAPIIRVEPAALSGTAQGLDLMTLPEARQALDHARDSGSLGLSARLNFSQQLKLDPAASHAASGQGFVMALPVYRSAGATATAATVVATSPQTVRQRRDALLGWALSFVSEPEFMAGLRNGLPAGLSLDLYDEDEPPPTATATATATTASTAGSAVAEPPLFRAHEQLLIGGRPWTLVLRAGPGFAAGPSSEDGSTGVKLLGIGLLLSLLLSLLAWLLGTARERAQTRAEQMTRTLRESEQRWAFALEGAGDGVWDWNVAAGTVSSSARWKTILGLRPGRPEPRPDELAELVHREDLPRARAELQRCLDGLTPNLISEFRVAGANGSGADGGWNWVLCRGTVVERDAQQHPLRMIGTLSDINARRLSEERVRFMALHDPLTELANRSHFGERVHFALANARRYNESLGLILLDLNRFKPVNDEHGHAVGDQLLQTVAKRIKSCVRETDTVGRIGGDEFVVLLTGPVTRDTAQVVADKIFNQVALPMELSGVRIEITCSLGLSLYPQDGVDEMSLTKAADDAMYRNKRAGRIWSANAQRSIDDYSGGGK